MFNRKNHKQAVSEYIEVVYLCPVSITESGYIRLMTVCHRLIINCGIKPLNHVSCSVLTHQCRPDKFLLCHCFPFWVIFLAISHAFSNDDFRTGTSWAAKAWIPRHSFIIVKSSGLSRHFW